MKRPLFLLTVLLCISIIIYKFFGFTAFVVAVFASVALFSFIIKRLSFVIIMIVLFSVAFVSVFKVRQAIDMSVKCSGEKYLFEFTVISDETETENAKCVTIKLNDNNLDLSNKKFNLYYRNCSLECGQKATAEINFFEYDSENNLYSLSKGIYGNFWLGKIVKDNGSDFFYKTLGNIRKFVKSFLFDNMSDKCAKTLSAIMLGDKSVLDDEFDLCIKKAGVSHIMAVSGLHLSVILGFLFFIFSKLIANKYFRFAFSIISVFAVAGICGFTPSILRAGFMFIVFAFAPIIKRDTDVLTVISFAVLSLLIFSPMLLFNISFQMSVLAIIAVMYVSPFYYGLIAKIIPHNKIIKAFVMAVIVSVMATIFTMPVAIYNFSYISLVCIITNLLISVPTTLVIELAMSGILLIFIPIISKFIMKIANYLTWYINSVIEFFGGLTYSAISVPQSFCLIPLFVMAVLLAFQIIKGRLKNGNGK